MKPDNKLTEINIAPTDGTAKVAGSRELKSDVKNLKIELNPTVKYSTNFLK